MAQIRAKIASNRKTMKITNAMQLVSTSRLGKTQSRMLMTRPYTKIIKEIIGHIASSRSDYIHPFMKKSKTVSKCGFIIISTDRGLCGSLNSHLFKLVLAELSHLADNQVDQALCLFGNKAIQYFSKFSDKVVASSKSLGDHPSMIDVIGIAKWMIDAYRDGEIQKVYIASNNFESVMKQNATLTQLLPLPKNSLEEAGSGVYNYLYEPNSKKILDVLLQRYIETLVYQAVVENVASEHAARMIAMKNATDNANQILEDLNLMYNKARQASITLELAEIVAGAGDIEEK
tara:strand:+ start:191 stop:1057 length:867 start_codon:yes stop_codon:yes gene_type:complete